MKRNMNEWISSVVSSQHRTIMPLMTHHGIELIGRKVIDAVTNGYIQFHAIQALYHKYPVSASTTIMDLTVEAEAFGSNLTFFDHEIPVITGRLVHDKESIEKLSIPDPGSGRLNAYLTAAHLSAVNLKNKPVIAGCIGPFSLAGRLFGMTEIMTSVYIEPEIISVLLRKCTDFLISYVTAFRDAGADGILIAEPAAGLLDEHLCDNFSSFFVREIIEKVQDENFMVILHNCGNTGHVTKSMVDTGAKAVHLGDKIDIIEALKEIPGDILVMGNLDPVGVFKSSSREAAVFAINELIEKTREYRNFVLSSGCDIPPGVPAENILAFFEACKYEYNIP